MTSMFPVLANDRVKHNFEVGAPDASSGQNIRIARIPSAPPIAQPRLALRALVPGSSHGQVVECAALGLAGAQRNQRREDHLDDGGAGLTPPCPGPSSPAPVARCALPVNPAGTWSSFMATRYLPPVTAAAWLRTWTSAPIPTTETRNLSAVLTCIHMMRRRQGAPGVPLRRTEEHLDYLVVCTGADK